VSVQVCPPILKAKLAVPLLAGVPLMVYVSEPLPLAKVPALRVAVKPVTPVEVAVCPLCVPQLPPVYGTALLTPLAAMPELSVPLLVAVPQSMELMEPCGEGAASLRQRTENPNARMLLYMLAELLLL
jgi:hypothetical protein